MRPSGLGSEWEVRHVLAWGTTVALIVVVLYLFSDNSTTLGVFLVRMWAWVFSPK